jgi:hypothetical protein
LVSGLGWALYEALDYGCKQNEQNILSPDLEQMIDFLTSAGKSGSFSFVVVVVLFYLESTAASRASRQQFRHHKISGSVFFKSGT